MKKFLLLSCCIGLVLTSFSANAAVVSVKNTSDINLRQVCIRSYSDKPTPFTCLQLSGDNKNSTFTFKIPYYNYDKIQFAFRVENPQNMKNSGIVAPEMDIFPGNLQNYNLTVSTGMSKQTGLGRQRPAKLTWF